VGISGGTGSTGSTGVDEGPDATAFRAGKLAAMRYFFAYELPKIDAWLGVVARREALVREIDPQSLEP
jgi:hypothetical protein